MDVTRKLLGLINEFSKASRYKINKQKSVTFLCANNERSEREIREIILFTISSKDLGICLSRETKDLYFKKYKMQKKKI